MVPFESLGVVSYSLSIVTMALSCISSKIKPDVGHKLSFFILPLAFGAPVRGVPVGILPSGLVRRVTDRQTDGQTFCHGIVCAMHMRCAVKIGQYLRKLCSNKKGAFFDLQCVVSKHVKIN